MFFDTLVRKHLYLPRNTHPGMHSGQIFRVKTFGADARGFGEDFREVLFPKGKGAKGCKGRLLTAELFDGGRGVHGGIDSASISRLSWAGTGHDRRDASVRKGQAVEWLDNSRPPSSLSPVQKSYQPSAVCGK